MSTTTANLKVWSAKEVTYKVINKEELFILDVRNDTDFNDWKIEGESIEIINIPYFDLIDGVNHILDKIPADKDVLVVCAKVGSSEFVAKQLLEATNRDIAYLEGGMKSWSEHLEPIKVGDLKDGGSIYQFVRIGKGCLSYMIVSNGEAAIVDTNRMIDHYESFAQKNNIKIKHLIDTHLHADHISGGRLLAEKEGATYWLPPKDAEEVVFSYNKLEDGNDITIGNTKVEINPIYSPGHTIGSTSLIVDNQYLLTGDILFVESIGRPDLAGLADDWVGDLRNTLYNLYTKLDKNLLVLPAHFGKVTELNDDGSVSEKLGVLYAENTGLKIDDEAQFKRTVTENLPPQPNAYQEIRQTNMGKITPIDEKQREMEIGPNRCAVHDN